MDSQSSFQQCSGSKSTQTSNQSFRLLKKVGGKFQEMVSVDFLPSISEEPLNPIMSQEEAGKVLKTVIEKRRLKEQGQFCENWMKGKETGTKNGKWDFEKEGKSGKQRVFTEPSPKSKYCSVCNKNFQNYFEHIKHPFHESIILKNPRNEALLNLIQMDDTFEDQKYQEEQNPPCQPWERFKRRPTLEDFRREQMDLDLSAPRKRKQHSRNNAKFASSTNIFSISAEGMK